MHETHSITVLTRPKESYKFADLIVEAVKSEVFGGK